MASGAVDTASVSVPAAEADTGGWGEGGYTMMPAPVPGAASAANATARSARTGPGTRRRATRGRVGRQPGDAMSAAVVANGGGRSIPRAPGESLGFSRRRLRVTRGGADSLGAVPPQ